MQCVHSINATACTRCILHSNTGSSISCLASLAAASRLAGWCLWTKGNVRDSSTLLKHYLDPFHCFSMWFKSSSICNNREQSHSFPFGIPTNQPQPAAPSAIACSCVTSTHGRSPSNCLEQCQVLVEESVSRWICSNTIRAQLQPKWTQSLQWNLLEHERLNTDWRHDRARVRFGLASSRQQAWLSAAPASYSQTKVRRQSVRGCAENARKPYVHCSATAAISTCKSLYVYCTVSQLT